MELRLALSDSMNTMRDYKLVRVAKCMYQSVRDVNWVTVSEWRDAHGLLLAQALAASFYSLQQKCI